MELRYWDSEAFLAWLKEEPGKVDDCRAILREAEAGRILIVTSALTLAEVIKLKHRTPIEKEHAEKIRAFFKNSYISIRNVDRFTAEKARELIWNYPPLQPKDSIHIATALQYKLTLLNTADEDLLKLDGRLGNPPLRIAPPSAAQLALHLEAPTN